jgi:hypothetical protein
MNRLTLWMRAVGVFYLINGLFNFPPFVEARLFTQYPSLGVSASSAAARALIDTWFMFGIEILVLGVALLYFAREPKRHIGLVWTVLALELVRGVFIDIYLIARGYDAAFVYVGWILLHVVIIVSGVLAINRARSQVPSLEVGDGRVRES